jgi:signal transduction histidine kinase
MKPEEGVSGHADAEVFTLLEALLKIGQRLEELTAGQVDMVADRDGRTFLLRGTQDQLRSSEDIREALILNNKKALEVQNERLEVAVAARTHELAEANKRLTILDRSKNDFLNLISHEFRTPLNGILGLSELILGSMPSTEENKELQELFEQSRLRLISMLEDAFAPHSNRRHGRSFAHRAGLLKCRARARDYKGDGVREFPQRDVCLAGRGRAFHLGRRRFAD